MNLIVIVILCIVAVIDLKLVLAHRRTISHRYQAMFPTWFDLVVLCLLIPGIIHINIDPTLKVLLAVLAGHVFFPNREYYR